MSTLKCSECFIEWYGLVGERCISCGAVGFVIRENPSLDSVRKEAREIPINDTTVVDSLLDIFEE